ncbi:NAD-dependent epimerase/dehydratase family protein [uncultured Massilia sp.]|uniref:NAD-dependent epimerase/dehydratase family protein n=1 Tax=uncultured Massilia sp. TaxID=169973 RepID=UPI0025E1423F|nr:NAD-dependent epimerase/dehydratase family protein [uncultured Massilia sp.]
MDDTMDKGTALVLGATGGIGGAVARRLLRGGWAVRALRRAGPGVAPGVAPHMTPQPAPAAGDIAWMQGDAMDAAAVARAAAGCDVIVHAVNPPGYSRWAQLVLPMLRNAIAAAENEGALLVVPGSFYNFGPDAFPLIAEEAPQHPLTRKGRVRVQADEALRACAARGRARVLTVRAGDYFGPGAGNNWFGQGLVKPGRPVTRILVPNDPGVGHQWAYLPDVAETMAALIARRAGLAPFAAFHMAGHWDPDGATLARAIADAVRRRGGALPATRRFPWWAAMLAAPFDVTMREVLEMRYLWRTPLRLDNRKLVALLGAEPHTPLERAVECTLEGLGCLPPTAPGAAAETAAPGRRPARGQ